MSSDHVLADLGEAVGDAVRFAFLSGVHLLQAARASMLLLDTSDGMMRVAAAVGHDTGVLASIVVPLGEGIAGLAAERNMTLFGEVGGRRYMSIPITHARTVLGVLNLTNRQGGHDFGDSDLALARSLAEHLGHLLARAQEGEIDRRSGLPDRTMLIDIMEREIERGRRVGSPFALALVGYRRPSERDEELLRSVGVEIGAACRGYDLVAHYGERAFAVLFPSTDAIGPETIERLHDILRRTREGTTREEIGGALVCYPADGTTARELLAQLERRYERASEGPPLPRVSPQSSQPPTVS